MRKITTQVLKMLLLVGAMVMLFAMPVSAATKTSVKILKVGESYTIKNTSKVKSSKTSVATAKKKSSTKYKVTAKKKGKTTLTVYNKKGKASQKIYLLVYNGKTFTYNTNAINLAKGKTKTVAASTNISGVSVKYASSDKNIATVNSNGKITAKKAGKATISAKFYYKGTKVKTLKKTVNVYTSSYDTSAISLTEGKTKTVSASISSNCTAKYSSSDTKVAKVNSSGKITAVKKGTATITCKVYLGSTNVKTYTKKVTVNAATTTTSTSGTSSVSYTLSSSSMTLSVNETATLKCKTDGSFKTNATYCSWSTSDSSIVSLDYYEEGGMVYPQYPQASLKAKKPGTATITCKVDNTTLSCKVTVSKHFQTFAYLYYDAVEGGKTDSVTVVSENASDEVTFSISNDNIREGAITKFTNTNNTRFGITEYETTLNFTGSKKGSCNIAVYVNGKKLDTFTVTVTSTDENYYIYQEWKQNMKDEIWTDDMTDREKIDAAAAYVRTHCVYIADQSGYMGLAVYGGGNCIAQADFVIDLAHDLGLEAEEYLVNGTYLGHVYAIVYYEPGIGTKVDIALS